nr:hypothetical protein [Conexibacter arvalis]
MEEAAERLRARGVRETRVEYGTEARYPSQTWELEVPLPTSRFQSPDDVAALADAFHDVHERVFAVKEPGQSIECLYWRARLTAKLDGPTVERREDPPAPAPAPRLVKQAWFGDRGWETPRYHGAELSAGVSLEGPLIVDEATTTVVVPPGCRLQTTHYGYIVSIGETSAASRPEADR